MIQIRQKKNAMQIDSRKKYLDKYFKQIRSKFESNNGDYNHESQFKMQEQKLLSKNMRKISKFYDASLNDNGLLNQIQNNNLIDNLQGIINQINDDFNTFQFQEIIIKKSHTLKSNSGWSSIKPLEQQKLQQSLNEIKYILILIANILKDKLNIIWTQQLIQVSMKMLRLLNISNLDIESSRKDHLKLRYILDFIGPEIFSYYICRIFYLYRYLEEQEQKKIQDEIHPLFYNILFFSMRSQVNRHIYLSRSKCMINQLENSNTSSNNKNFYCQLNNKKNNEHQKDLSKQALLTLSTKSYFQQEHSLISFNQDIVKCLHEFIDHQQQLYETYTLEKIKRNVNFIKKIISSHYQMIDQYEEQSDRDQRIINWVMSSYFGVIEEKLYWFYSYMSISEDPFIIQEIFKKAQLIGLIVRGCNYAGSHLKPVSHIKSNIKNNTSSGLQVQQQNNYLENNNRNNDSSNGKKILSSYQINSYCYCLLKSIMKNNVMTGLTKNIIADQIFLNKLFSNQKKLQEKGIKQYVTNVQIVTYIQQKANFIQFIIGQFYIRNTYEEIVASKWKQILDFSFEVIQSYTEMNMSMIRITITTIIKALRILTALISEGTNDQRQITNEQRRNRNTNANSNTNNSNNKYLLYWNNIGGNNLMERLNMLIKHNPGNHQYESEQELEDIELLVDYYMLQQFSIE